MEEEQGEDTKVLEGYIDNLEETYWEVRQEEKAKCQAAEEMWLKG